MAVNVSCKLARMIFPLCRPALLRKIKVVAFQLQNLEANKWSTGPECREERHPNSMGHGVHWIDAMIALENAVSKELDCHFDANTFRSALMEEKLTNIPTALWQQEEWFRRQQSPFTSTAKGGNPVSEQGQLVKKSG